MAPKLWRLITMFSIVPLDLAQRVSDLIPGTVVHISAYLLKHNNGIVDIEADVLTPAPRDSGPNARSWLVFEGPIHAESTTSPITVHATASNYYHEIPLSYRLPEPQIYGQLLMHILIDSDTVSAKSNQVMVSIPVPRFKSTHPDAFDSAGPDIYQYFWINGIITNTKESFIYVEIDALIV
ncbi:hypothetical protein PGT21_020808 [Puccinia graminis f. sp. tritici]|uniref:Arrestin-like N-terminal domain-containing protein n=1 Tax=Puccinia graminis f. sp. tritici TaxID=56615 RepID=A0A5B0MBJ6_PUCGR|nr:hypothetical protein PGT21_020808 [Puccinia graminis f. sp. tritici]